MPLGGHGGGPEEKAFPYMLANLIALPSARKTQRVRELVRLFAHAAGGRVSERLLARLGMAVSDNAILRQLKSHVRKQRKMEPLRAIAIDDWSWRPRSARRSSRR
jgi:hypothetical protein